MEQGGNKKWPGEMDETFPEVFTVPPPQPSTLKPGQLSAEQVQQFFKEGFLIIRGFWKKEELDPCLQSSADYVDQLAQVLYKHKQITDLHSDLGVFERLTALSKECPDAIVIMINTVLGSMAQPLKDLWRNERILNMTEQLLGTSDILGNPVWNLRNKIPQNQETIVPWHQDAAYMDNENYKMLLLTAWIPFLDTNEKNGTIQMVKGGHRHGKVAKHTCCWGNTWYVDLAEEEMEKTLDVDLKKDAVTCNVNYGDFVLFNNLTPHRSVPNLSKDVRWSVDLRWQRADKPIGFYNLKPGVLLRSGDDANLKINWEPFDGVDRTKAQVAEMHTTFDKLETTVVGPWMNKWEITHHNKHTRKLEEMAQ